MPRPDCESGIPHQRQSDWRTLVPGFGEKGETSGALAPPRSVNQLTNARAA